MVFLDPVVFYGLLGVSLFPLILGFAIRWPLIGMVTGAFMFLLFSFAEGLVVDRPVVDITGNFTSTSADYDFVYGETGSAFTGETRLLLSLIALLVLLFPVLFQIWV